MRVMGRQNLRTKLPSIYLFYHTIGAIRERNCLLSICFTTLLVLYKNQSALYLAVLPHYWCYTRTRLPSYLSVLPHYWCYTFQPEIPSCPVSGKDNSGKGEKNHRLVFFDHQRQTIDGGSDLTSGVVRLHRRLLSPINNSNGSVPLIFLPNPPPLLSVSLPNLSTDEGEGAVLLGAPDG